MRAWLTIFFALAAATATFPAVADDQIKLLAGPQALTGSFGFVSTKSSEKKRAKEIRKLRTAVSGVACEPGGRCLLVFDEGRAARYATLTQAAFTADPAPVRLSEGDQSDELDAEGAATGEQQAIYVTGSHARGRKPPDGDDPESKKFKDLNNDVCTKRLDSRSLFKVTGAAIEPPKTTLLSVLESIDALKAGLDKCLFRGEGVDIEGVAFADKRLHFGFRGPKPSTHEAYVLSVPVANLFADATDEAPKLETVKVGEGLAIRDITAVSGGFLLLVGPDDLKANAEKPFSIAFWDGKTVTDRGQLPRSEPRTFDGCKDEEKESDRKPEGVAVMSATDAAWTVVVVSDGLCDGGPTWYEVKRPPTPG